MLVESYCEVANGPVEHLYRFLFFFLIGKCDDIPAPHLASWGINHQTSRSPSDFS